MGQYQADGTKRTVPSAFRAQDPQILGATVHKAVARGVCTPHPTDILSSMGDEVVNVKGKFTLEQTKKAQGGGIEV